MKRRIIAALMALCLCIGLLPATALAVDASAENEYVKFEYESTQLQGLFGTVTVIVQNAEGDSLGDPIVVYDYYKTGSIENTITVIDSGYQLKSVEQSKGTKVDHSITSTEAKFTWTFIGDDATLYVTLAERDEGLLEGGEVDHAGIVYFNVTDYELLKMLYGANVEVSADTEITNVTLRYEETNQLLDTEDFVSLAGYIETDYVDYWQADASNGSFLATPYNVSQLEIEYNDGSIAVIPNADLHYTRDGDTYWIESRAETPYIVAFYNENNAATENNYSLYAIRFIDQSGETVAENGGMPQNPEYDSTDYVFASWTVGYDGGQPFLSTTPVTGDTVVYAQKVYQSSKQTEIHVMNNDDLFVERLEELFGTDQIDMESVKITVNGSGGEQTNPDYTTGGGTELEQNRWVEWDDSEYGYYLVYNYLPGAEGTGQGNTAIHINEITSIDVTATVTIDGEKTAKTVRIQRGNYDGDFEVSTGSTATISHIIELYINSDNYPENPDTPDPDPGDDYAITGINKTLVDSGEEKDAAQNAGIVVDSYTYPNDEGTVIIPEDGTVTLLYAITVTGKEGAAFTVTDTGADLVAGAEIAEDPADTFTGSIPAGATSITFYVSKTFDADDLENASEGDGTVLKNTANVAGENAGDADPDEDEDTEETPAEEEDPTKPDFDDDVLAGVTVQVLCVQNPTGHKYVSTLDQHPEAYETKIEPCADDEKVNGVLLPDGFDWKCTVSISKEYFVKYFNDVAKLQSNLWGEHELAESEKTTEIVLYYGSDGWELLGSTSSVIIQVKEKSTGTYTLTYDANGGTINGEDTWSKEVARGLVTLASVDGYNAPIHAQEELDGKLVDVAFVGWSTTDSDTIYEAGQALPDTVTTVTISGNTTVYAVWGYDTNGDKVADATQVLITPADIIIYEGGTGYEAVVENPDDATAVPGVGGEESTGLPEPGFYITLPYEINNALKEQAEEDENINDKKVVNLSEYLTFNYSYGDTERTWKLALYDSDGASHLDDGRYIYRILPAEVDQDGDGTISEDEKIPIRLLFTDENNNETTSDDFTFSASDLYAEFQMTIYDGGLEQNLVTASVQNVDGAQDLDVGVGTGTLTIRGVREENPENAVSEIVTGELLEPVTDITAQAEEGVTYYVNDSPLAVENQDKVQLLADKLADTPEVLTDAAEDAIKAKLENPEYDFMYLDLVDSSNGNAYVTLGDDDTITIHWPIPGDAKEGSAFYVVHFDGLDRDYDVDTELEGLLTDENITVYEKDGTNDLTVSEDGKSVSFETSTFSPFALVYEQKDGTTPVTKYTVTYDANGGKGAMASQTVNAGNSVTIKANTFTRSDHTFTGWNTRADGTGTGYAAGNTITPNSNLTLYAQWKSTGDSGYDPKEATLRFNSRGGTEFEDEVRDNPFRYNPYNKIPTRPGYRFTGWYDSSRLDDRYDEDEEISVPMGITTVWAGWEETSVPSMLNGDDHYAYIQGYSDGTVRPNANITRAQVATIFFRLLDEDVRDDNLTTYNTFPDVDQDYWANTAISTMASLGVINGRNSGLFDPDAYITRAEFAAICARFDDSGVDGITTFTDTVGHWAEDEISRAAALGWIQGYADGTFRPNQYITRAQAVTMINRVLCRLPEDTDDLLSGMNTWTDCHEDDWFYLAIQEATNSHDFVAKDRVYESWTDLNRAPDWSRYE